MPKQFFKSKEKVIRENASRTKLAKIAAKQKHEDFLNSESGQQALKRVSLASELAEHLASKL